MATALSNVPTERIRRVDVLAYVIGVMGVVFVGYLAEAALAADITTYAIGQGTMGLFAIPGAVLVYRNPENLDNGAEPAPAYLYVLPVVSTLAFLVLAVGWILRVF